MKNENELYAIRRKKLSNLVSQYSSYEEFSKVVDKDRTYIARLLYPPDKPGAKRMGDKMALQFELSLNLPRGYFDGLADSEFNYEEFTSRQERIFRVDVLDVSASAGTGVMLKDEFIETIYSIEYTNEEARKIFNGRNADSIKVITVKGDSMLGTLDPGDQVFVDVNVNEFLGDGIYIFVLDNELYLKRLQSQRGKIAVISDNKVYDTWYLEGNERQDIRILAKVLLSQSIEYKKHG